MTEEISLSIAETNQLRAKLGLKLIPEPKVETKSSNELTIEETNKLRLSLGLKPIVEDNKPVEVTNKQEEGDTRLESNYSRDLVRQRIEAAKLKTLERRRWVNAEKTLLGVSDNTDEWLSNLGKKPEVAAKDSSGLKKRIRVSTDTEGIAVDHSVSELSRLSNNDVLTLKDVDVLDSDAEGDELENTLLSKRRKLKHDLDEKTKADNIKNFGRHYRDEAVEEKEGEESEAGVVISGNRINLSKATKIEARETDDVPKKKVLLLNLFDDEEHDFTAAKSDYSKPKHIKMKKLKKKSSSLISSSVSRNFDEPIAVVRLDTNADVNEDLDDEMETILSLNRKTKQKSRRKNLTPEEIANEISINQRLEAEEEVERAAVASAASGMVFDDTTDFLDSLKPEVEVEIKTNLSKQVAPPLEDSSNLALALSHDVSEDKEVDRVEDKELEDNGVEGSSVSFGGLGSTLKFLQSQNIIQKTSAEEQQRTKELRETQKKAELLKLNVSIEERILRDELSKDKAYMNTPKVEREELFEKYLDQRLREKGILSDINTKTRESNGKLKNYNPQVKLAYRDENGVELNTKQAYKVLSHQFHGVGPSAGKVAKQQRKREPTGTKEVIH